MQQNYRQLGCAVAIRALKDFFRADKREDETAKRTIIKDLCSDWMDLLTDGLSIKLAKELKNNPEQVKKRFKLYERRNYHNEKMSIKQ